MMYTCRSYWGDDRFQVGKTYEILRTFKKEGENYVQAVANTIDGVKTTVDVKADYFNPWNTQTVSVSLTPP